MPSAFDAQLAAASPMLDQQFGEAVSVTRGVNVTAGVIASWTQQAVAVVSPDGLHTAIIDRIWLIRKTLYLIDSTAVQPRQGDQLIDAGGQGWEVLPANISPPSESFEHGDYWSIPTKRVT
jgi:hypothetical protein